MSNQSIAGDKQQAQFWGPEFRISEISDNCKTL